MYLPYVNQLRAIGSLFVAFSHCIHGLQWGHEWGNDEIMRLLKVLFMHGVLLFVFIAGFIFQHLLYKFDYWKYLKTRFMLVVLPYLIISIPAIIAWTFIFERATPAIPQGFYDEPWWYRVLYLYITGDHVAPLWFIPFIAMIYILAPLFRFIDLYPRLYWSLPFLIIIPYLYPRSWNPIQELLHFFPVYILGMAASRYKERVLEWSWRSRYVLFVLFAGLVCYEWLVVHTYQSFITYMNKICLAFLLLAILARHGERIKWLTWYATINFGVFFLHGYANAGLKILFLGAPAQPLPIVGNIPFQFMYFAVVVGLSIGGILVIKKLSGRYSRYIVGA